MKIEDGDVTAEFVPGRMGRNVLEADVVRFTEGEMTVDVPLHILELAWHAWA